MTTPDSKAALKFENDAGISVTAYATARGVEYGIIRNGVEARVARPTPSLDSNIPMLTQDRVLLDNTRSFKETGEMVTPGVTPLNPPFWYTRGAKALWWSVQDLIEHDPCYFWLVTQIHRNPDSWFGNMFRTFVYNLHIAGRRGKIPPCWGGIRVFEPHPGGHGLHAHMVMRCRMDHHVVQDCATRAGLGLVFVDPNRCTILSAFYLAKYLNKGAEIAGVRRWSCIGGYTGIKKNEIETSGTRIDRIKSWQGYYRYMGMHRYAAFLRAVQTVESEDHEALVKLLGRNN